MQEELNIYSVGSRAKGFYELLKKLTDSELVEAYDKLTATGCQDDLKMARITNELKMRGYVGRKSGEWVKNIPKGNGESQARKEVIKTQYLVNENKSKEQQKAEQQAVDISQAVTNALQVFRLGYEQPVKSNDELKARIESYLEDCATNSQLPTVEKLFLCLGYTIKTIEGWYNGKYGREKWVDESTIEILDMGKQVIQAIDSELVQNGKIGEKSYMFRSKNFYDMKDKTDIVVAPANNEIESEDELRRQYLKELQ